MQISADGKLQTIENQLTHQPQKDIRAGTTPDKNGSALTLPIKSFGQVLGGIKIRKLTDEKWTQDQLELVNTLSEQISIALENARMLENLQRRAALEQAIGDMSAKIGASTEIEDVLRTAVQELGRQIGNAKIAIELNPEVAREESGES